jgi:hypothetical protein
MTKRLLFALLTAILCCMWAAVVPYPSALAKDKDLKPEELVAEHVKSVGNPEVLKGLQSRVLEGSTSVRFILGANGQLVGQARITSEGRKLGLLLQYGSLHYPAEHFAFDGKDVTVAYIDHGVRSPLGTFITQYTGLMKEGLLGGALSTAWALLDIQERQPDMKCRKKKVAGRELYDLDYKPRKGLGGLSADLYFDPNTFHHVRSEYRIRITGPMQAQQGNTGREVADSIYLLTEEFDDFKEVDGMVLPHRYSIQYSIEGAGSSFLATWTVDAKQWVHNGTIEPKIFAGE